MQDRVNATPEFKASAVEQWQADGGKAPLRPKHVWSILDETPDRRQHSRPRMFNLAIDSSCEAVTSLPSGWRMSLPADTRRIAQPVRQKKTGRPVRFELSEQTRQAVDDYLKATGKRPREYLFTGRRGPDRSMTTRQYARLVPSGSAASD